MATRNIDGSNVDRYQGRITGTFDVDEEEVRYGDVVMAVVIVDVDQLVLKAVRGDDVGTYVFKAKDFAVVTDEAMQKQLYYHLPHLQPSPALEDEHDDGVDVTEPPARWSLEKIDAVLPPDPRPRLDAFAETTVNREQMDAESVDAHDAEDGEVFSPADESRERARLVGAARDPILKRFLNGD